MYRIVLCGVPTAGKSTLSYLAAQALGVPQISVGLLLRTAAAANTNVRTYLSAGRLLDDRFVAGLVEGELTSHDAGRGFVLDGFPRNLAQLTLLDSLPCCRQSRFVFLDLDPDEARRRYLRRMSCLECKRADYGSGEGSLRRCERCGGPLQRRPDANLEALNQKLDSFDRHERPMLLHLDKQGRLLIVRVSGDAGRDLGLLLGRLGVQ